MVGRVKRMVGRVKRVVGWSVMPTWSLCAPIATYWPLSFGSLPGISATTLRAGVAMGMLAEPVAKALVASGDLELVLTDHAPSTSGLFLYYPSRKQVMPKLRAFIDYVRDYLPDDVTG